MALFYPVSAKLANGVEKVQKIHVQLNLPTSKAFKRLVKAFQRDGPFLPFPRCVLMLM